jgi:hypothetical protein
MAEIYPTRPVHIIVGFPAASGPDIVARLLGSRLSERLGQQFFVENRPGAASNIATERERGRAKLRNRSLSLCLGVGDIEVEKMRIVDTGPDKYRVILDVRKAKDKVPRASAADIPRAPAFRQQRLRRRKGA